MTTDEPATHFGWIAGLVHVIVLFTEHKVFTQNSPYAWANAWKDDAENVPWCEQLFAFIETISMKSNKIYQCLG